MAETLVDSAVVFPSASKAATVQVQGPAASPESTWPTLSVVLSAVPFRTVR